MFHYLGQDLLKNNEKNAYEDTVFTIPPLFILIMRIDKGQFMYYTTYLIDPGEIAGIYK